MCLIFSPFLFSAQHSHVSTRPSGIRSRDWQASRCFSVSRFLMCATDAIIFCFLFYKWDTETQNIWVLYLRPKASSDVNRNLDIFTEPGWWELWSTAGLYPKPHQVTVEGVARSQEQMTSWKKYQQRSDGNMVLTQPGGGSSQAAERLITKRNKAS